MPNSMQVLCALAMAVWVMDVRFAPKPAAATHTTAELVSCQSGPSASAPAGADLELVVCAKRLK